MPNNGESLNDMVPPHYLQLFNQIAAEMGDGSVVMPYPIWCEASMNDADAGLLQSACGQLNPHPFATFTDGISLSMNPAEMEVAKSCINCTEDTSLPHSMTWHPRLSEKLGLCRLLQIPSCFTAPERLSQAIMVAGRD